MSLINGHGVMFQKSNGMVDDLDEDGFFDLLSRFQSRRIDDQRCSFRLLESGVPATPKSVVSDGGNKDLAALGQCPWPPTLWPCTLPSTSHSVPLLPALSAPTTSTPTIITLFVFRRVVSQTTPPQPPPPLQLVVHPPGAILCHTSVVDLIMASMIYDENRAVGSFY